MRLIDKIKVGWKQYSVQYFTSGQINEADGEYLGRAFHGTNEIRINNTYPADQQEAALLHEVLHCADVYAGLNLSEDQITGLANMLYQIIKENEW